MQRPKTGGQLASVSTQQSSCGLTEDLEEALEGQVRGEAAQRPHHRREGLVVHCPAGAGHLVEGRPQRAQRVVAERAPLHDRRHLGADQVARHCAQAHGGCGGADLAPGVEAAQVVDGAGQMRDHGGGGGGDPGVGQHLRHGGAAGLVHGQHADDELAGGGRDGLPRVLQSRGTDGAGRAKAVRREGDAEGGWAQEGSGHAADEEAPEAAWPRTALT